MTPTQQKTANENSANSQQNSTSNHIGNSAMPNVQSLPVCHPNIPKLNGLGNITFEILFLIYLCFALLCQYIYLFKARYGSHLKVFGV